MGKFCNILTFSLLFHLYSKLPMYKYADADVPVLL